MKLDDTLAARMAEIALGHVTREFPHKLDHVMAGPRDARTPRDLHPIFFGSFDWHSCVHGWWLLLRLLRCFPGHAAADATRALATGIITPEAAAIECAYLAAPMSRGFERPYGWAWLLALHGEASRHADGRHAATLEPLARVFSRRFHDYLPLMTYPIRTGAHGNTAFALVLAAQWAADHDPALLRLIAERARGWFGADRAAQAWEPDGDAFLSPALCEALLMARLLPADDFRGWMAGFLPDATDRAPASLFTPAMVSDRSDGKIAHLDGLNLSRAWCWREVAAGLGPQHPLSPVAEAPAAAHLAAGLPHIA
ncbi:MAG: DUF2891 domain-containing protein, partial [Sandarakinorhabdus sp.]|nr:DUF2891 domain-containing protein [Sandarakinorhabdus sp.]